MRRRRVNAGLAIVCVLAFVFLIAPCLLRDPIAPGPNQSHEWIYWLQVTSGNWQPILFAPGDTSAPRLSRWTFAFSAILAVFLNNSLIFVLVTLLWRQFTTWRTQMKLGQAFVQRDEINKNEVLKAFKVNGQIDDETMAKVESAFRSGASKWQENARQVFGEEEAGRLMAMLGQTI